MYARHDKRQSKCKNGISIIPFNITPYINNSLALIQHNPDDCLQMNPIWYLIKKHIQ